MGFSDPFNTATTPTDFPSSKLKEIRIEEESKINEEVDAYLYHLSKVDVPHINCLR